jgi:hypothetical protein
VRYECFLLEDPRTAFGEKNSGFLQTVYERLLKLEEQTKGFKIENLSDNPLFITTANRL